LSACIRGLALAKDLHATGEVERRLSALEKLIQERME
jgi:hypothetical protein